jgi:hypothetical protein
MSHFETPQPISVRLELRRGRGLLQQRVNLLAATNDLRKTELAALRRPDRNRCVPGEVGPWV